jgi:hypothetical protein
MANPAALLLSLQEHAAQNHIAIAENTTCNTTYMREFKNFKEWVQGQPDLATQTAPFLTPINVDHYFTRVITCRAGNRNTIRRVINALDWYGVNREHIGAKPKYSCTSTYVEAALKVQQIYHKSVGGTGKPGSDPHLGLKDIFPESDRIRIMEYIYGHRNDWGPASVNFTWGINGAVRGASNRKLTFCDLNLSYGFGPERAGPLSRAILLILRKGDIHKDRHETDKQVCTWRHINYLLCSMFSTAAYVIWKITQTEPTISFLHANKDERAGWWDAPLIDWEEYSGECALCFKSLFSTVTDSLGYYRGVFFHEGNL